MCAERARRWHAAWLVLLLALPGVASALAPIQHWRTPNGARVYFVPARELPMVDARVVFDAGSARDAGHPGLARLTNALLDQGAGGLSADELADRLGTLGAQLNTGSRRDMAWVSLRSLSAADKLRPAAALAAKVIGAPAFHRPDFKRERQRLLVAAKQREQQPDQVAEEAFHKALYGDHPYASPPGGTPADLPVLTDEEVQGFYLRYYTARNAVVAIVGDLDAKAAHRLARTLTARLDKGDPAGALPPVSPLTGSTTRSVDFPSTQSTVLMGQPGVRRGDPDYFPLYVGNYVLGGGGLVSRLNEQIREKRGLSYSVYSYFLPMARKGPFVLGLQTRSDQTRKALDLMHQVLARYVKKGPTAEELEAAKKHITGGFALRIDTNRKVVEYLAMIGFYHLPLDYLQRFNARVEAVTREQIVKAFQRRVHPDRMVTVIVGPGSDAPKQ